MLRGLWTLCVFFVVTTGLGIAVLLVALVRPGSDFVMRAARIWSRAILSAMGTEVEYRGRRHATARLPCVYIANHQSYADIWVLCGALPHAARFVAKRSLFRIPIMGWAMAASGFIAIDRHRRQHAIRSLERAAERIRSGSSVVLFPEGTRSRSGRLGPFKKGPFHLALQAGVPVVPVAISGSRDVLRRGSLRVTPGRVRVTFLPPVDVGPFGPDDYRALSDRVRSSIEGVLERPPGRGGAAFEAGAC